MPITYDPTLSTDRDWVRFLTRDTNLVTAALQDEEIDAMLLEETVRVPAALKYVTAARVLDLLVASWAGVSHGLKAKTVGRLKLEWGGDGGNLEALHERINYLLRRAAEICERRPLAFRTLGNSQRRSFP